MHTLLRTDPCGQQYVATPEPRLCRLSGGGCIPPSRTPLLRYTRKGRFVFLASSAPHRYGVLQYARTRLPFYADSVGMA